MTLKYKKANTNGFYTCPSQLNLEVEFERGEIQYENLSGRFTCLNKDFKKQFVHIYSNRLLKMKDRVIKSASQKWGQEIPVRKLSDLSNENNEKCIIIGTLFKHQQLKPSILKELSEENQVMPQPPRSNYVSDDDQLILEDEVQRIRLVGSFDIKKFVTGVVIGVLGFENQEGKFEAEDVCFAGVEPTLHRPLIEDRDRFLIMVSGVDVGNTKSALALQLLVDFIKGNLGCISDEDMWAKVCRVLIAGNSVSSSQACPDRNKISFFETNPSILSSVKQLDDVLLDLVTSVEVDLMPGEFDPSNYFLPQQSMYDCVTPKASQYESLHCVTNPYECKLGGRRILGTSGQPINDIKCVTDMTEPLEILEKTLLWGHLAPTAPDTLACYPFYDDDPFIISEQPDIYFVGNQPEFSTKTITLNGHQTTIICIPSFSKSQACVSINLRTLECTPITFTT